MSVLVSIAAQAHAQRPSVPDTVLGVVTTQGDSVVPAARIVVRQLGGGDSVMALSNALGRFTAVIAGSGRYAIEARAIGLRSVEVTASRPDSTHTIIVPSIRLGAVTLEKVTVRPRPHPRASRRPSTMESLRDLPDFDPRDALLNDATQPSVLGAGTDQNQYRINGIDVGPYGLLLPARSVTVTSADASVGGGSGGILSSDLANWVTTGALHSLDGRIALPQLQWVDPASAAIGQRYSEITLATTTHRAIVPNRVLMSTRIEVLRHANPRPSLTRANAVALQRLGVAPDSVARLVQLLQAADVPVTTDAVPVHALNEGVSFTGRIDYRPRADSAGVDASVTFTATHRSDQGLGFLPTAFPATGAGFSADVVGVSADVGHFIGPIFNRIEATWSTQRSGNAPYLTMPAAAVTVASELPDGTAGSSVLQFGGTSVARSNTHRTVASITNTARWVTRDFKHVLNMTLDARGDWNRATQGDNPWGHYTFNSLADLALNRPASYTRLLDIRAEHATNLQTAASFTDAWRATWHLQVLYGLRFDWRNTPVRPAFNSRVDSVFGIRTNQVPRSWAISPRAGLSWSYGRGGWVVSTSRAERTTSGAVRATVGMYEGLIPSSLVASMAAATGLPGSLRQLTCVGDAVPLPVWDQFGTGATNIPSACADHSGPATLISDGHLVSAFGSGYAPPRSWRVDVEFPIAPKGLIYLRPFAYLSWNTRQPSVEDVNFSGIQQFVLAREGNRPMFAPTTSIVPSTGAVSTSGALYDTSYSQVMVRRSDLHSVGTTWGIAFSPTSALGLPFQWMLQYKQSRVVGTARGFDQTTAGDPRVIERMSFAQPHHTIGWTLGVQATRRIALSFNGQFTSGLPFTPRVAGDINGDGLSNDRAFIFDPATAVDPTLANDVSTLLDIAPERTRKCLRAQLGTIAATNSCSTPWTASMAALVTFQRMRGAGAITVGLVNPLAAIDRVMHGWRGMHGWGQPSYPDPVLLRVHGFDASTRTFRYDVNPRFGDTRFRSTAIRSPYSLIVSFSTTIGPSRDRLNLRGLPQGGSLSSFDSVTMVRQVWNAYAREAAQPILTFTQQVVDSLALTPGQRERIDTIGARYLEALEDVWTKVAYQLMSPRARHHEDMGMALIRAAQAETRPLLYNTGEQLFDVLTPGQRALVPTVLRTMFDRRRSQY